MSKPIIRIVLAVLISLGIIAASSPNVQARLGSLLQKADVKSANAYISADDHAFGRARYFQSDDFAKDSYHDCGSDPTVDY